MKKLLKMALVVGLLLAVTGSSQAWYTVVINNAKDGYGKYMVPADLAGYAWPYISGTLIAGGGDDLDEVTVQVRVHDWSNENNDLGASSSLGLSETAVFETTGSYWCAESRWDEAVTNYHLLYIYVDVYYNGELQTTAGPFASRAYWSGQ